MSARAKHLALVILLVLTACDEDNVPQITEPAPPQSPGTTPAVFNVYGSLYLDVQDPDPTPSLRLTAFLHAGFEDDLPRPASDTMWIDDQPLLPEEKKIPIRSYLFEEAIDPSAAHQRIVRVRPPTVDGVSKDEITLAFVGRSTGDTLTRTPEGDLFLPVLIPTATLGPPPAETDWYATIIDSTTHVASVHGYEMPGGQLRVPAFYLPPPQAQGRVLFEIYSGNREQAESEDAYVVGYRVTSSFQWPIAPGPP